VSAAWMDMWLGVVGTRTSRNYPHLEEKVTW